MWMAIISSRCACEATHALMRCDIDNVSRHTGCRCESLIIHCLCCRCHRGPFVVIVACMHAYIAWHRSTSMHTYVNKRLTHMRSVFECHAQFCLRAWQAVKISLENHLRANIAWRPDLQNGGICLYMALHSHHRLHTGAASAASERESTLKISDSSSSERSMSSRCCL